MRRKQLSLVLAFLYQSASAQSLINGFGLPMAPATPLQNGKVTNQARKHAAGSKENASLRATSQDDFPRPISQFFKKLYNVDLNLSKIQTSASGEWKDGGSDSLVWRQPHFGVAVDESFRELDGQELASGLYVVDPCMSADRQDTSHKDRCDRIYEDFVSANQSNGLIGHLPDVAVRPGGRGLQFDVDGFSSVIIEQPFETSGGKLFGITFLLSRKTKL